MEFLSAVVSWSLRNRPVVLLSTLLLVVLACAPRSYCPLMRCPM